MALKVNALVGIKQAPNSLALVAATGSLLSIFANPFFGRMSDRTSSKLGMRRPWMVIGLVVGSLGVLVVALAPNIPVVLLGWCIAQVFFNALLAAMVAVLPDQVPVVQRGQVSGVLGVCVPIASVSGTFVAKLFTGNQLTIFLAPCAIGGFFILLFAVTLKDRRLAKADKPTWRWPARSSSTRGRARTSRGLSPVASCRSGPRVPDRVPGLLPAGRSAAPRPMCRNRYSSAPSPGPSSSSPLPSSVAGSLTGRADGRSSSSQRRSCTAWRCSWSPSPAASTVSWSGWPSADSASACMRPSTLPWLSTCCQTTPEHAAKDLGVFNIAGALPFSIAPAIAPAILTISSGRYGVLCAIAGVCAIIGAFAILPVKGVR